MLYIDPERLNFLVGAPTRNTNSLTVFDGIGRKMIAAKIQSWGHQ
jgi:hypothetical protein